MRALKCTPWIIIKAIAERFEAALERPRAGWVRKCCGTRTSRRVGLATILERWS